MRMIKKLLTLALALLLPATALAEVYEGTTAALSTVTVTAGTSGLVQGIDAAAGSRVDAGDALVSLKAERVFASQDGTVSLVNARVGDAVDGTLLEVTPLNRYQIHCTVDKAYQSAEATLVHSGETVYVRCTTDGTHRAIGLLTRVDGSEYRVITLGGELYLGETVYLYRDEAFTASQRIGIGTVVANDAQGYEASGTVTGLWVEEGDEVERGQLLYAMNGGTVVAPVSGIISAVSIQPGDRIESEAVVAEIVPDGQVCVELRVSESEAARFSTGQSVRLTKANDPDEITFGGTVADVAWVAEDDRYAVRIMPEEGLNLSLGMSVTVRTAEE